MTYNIAGLISKVSEEVAT